MMRDRAALPLVLLGLAVYAIAPGTGDWARSVVSSAAQIYHHRNSSRETRAASLLGEPFRIVDEARRTTPANARIVIPGGAPFDPLSNRVWCDYYLHPRTLLFRDEWLGAPAGAADFLLVYRGSNLDLLGVPADSVRGTEQGVFPLRRGADGAGGVTGGTR